MTKTILVMALAATLILSTFALENTAFANTIEVQGDINPEDNEKPTINCKKGNGVFTLVIYGKSDSNQTFDPRTIKLDRNDSVQTTVTPNDGSDPVALDLPQKFLIFEDENGIVNAKIKFDKNAFCTVINENFDRSQRDTFTITTLIPVNTGEDDFVVVSDPGVGIRAAG